MFYMNETKKSGNSYEIKNPETLKSGQMLNLAVPDIFIFDIDTKLIFATPQIWNWLKGKFG